MSRAIIRKGFEKRRIQGFEDSRSRKRKDSRSRKEKGSRIRGVGEERVQGFEDLEKKGFKDSRIQGVKWFSWYLFSNQKRQGVGKAKDSPHSTQSTFYMFSILNPNS